MARKDSAGAAACFLLVAVAMNAATGSALSVISGKKSHLWPFSFLSFFPK
jgi:hypothetical protein